MGDEQFVRVTKTHYESLLEDARMLAALEAAGVDNWEGYSVALNELEDED